MKASASEQASPPACHPALPSALVNYLSAHGWHHAQLNKMGGSSKDKQEKPSPQG